MINKKISTIAGSLIIVAIVAALGFSFLGSNKKEEIQGQNNIVLDNSDSGKKEEVKQGEEKVIGNNSAEKNNAPIADGIYENMQYGYKINIPENFIINKNGPAQDRDSLIRIFPKTDKPFMFSVYVSNSKFKNIDSWLIDYKQNLSKINSYEGIEIDTPSITSKERININGITAIKIVLNNMPFSNYLIVFIKDNLLYEFLYNGFLTDQEELDIAGKQVKNKNDLTQEYKLKHRQELDKIFDSMIFTK